MKGTEMTRIPTQLRYLTDAAFEITTPEGIVLIDCSEYTPPALMSSGVIAAVSSHQHADHCDRRRLAQLGVPVWAPADTVPLLEADGVRSASVLSARSAAQVSASLRVTAVPVSHGSNANHVMNFGLIIEVNGWRIWYTGDIGSDTEPHPGGEFDLVIVCAGGTYVFSPDEAATYLDRLGHKGPALGVHFDYAPSMSERFLEGGEGAAWWPLVLPSGGTYHLGGE